MYSEALITKTIATWQPLSAQPLGELEAVETLENVIGYLRLLHRWAEAARASEASTTRFPNGKSHITGTSSNGPA